MSQKSGSSESDWCIVSSQSTSSSTTDDQSSMSELGFENQTAIKNETEKSQNECSSETQNIERDESRNEILEDVELSEGNTDSSSDVEILEESVGSNLLSKSDERNDTDVAFHGGSLSFSIVNPSAIESASTESNGSVSESLALSKTSSSSAVDKNTQTLYVTNHQFNYDRYLHSVGEWLNHRYEVYNHQIHLTVAILLGCMLAVLTFCHFNYSDTQHYFADSSHLEMSLNEIQSSIVQCFGEQHLEGLRRGDERFLSLPVCMHNIKKHNDTIKSLLDSKVRHFLLIGLYEPDDPFYLSFEDNHDELYLDIIINELQFLKLLPVPEPLMEANEKLSDNKMNNQMASPEQSEQFKTDDLVVVKDPAYQLPINEHHETANLDSYKQLMMDLNAEIALLHFEKLKLQNKIDEGHNTCTSQVSCSTANKILEEKNRPDQEEPLEKASPEQDTAEKIKPYLDDLASVLSGEILNLHKSLVNELREVKKWNELLQNMTMEARNPSEQSEGSSWSWKEIRENVENVILETHKDFKEKISAFQLDNLTETVQTIVEDNKKNAEYLLNVVNHYFNAVKEKTQAILETPVPEIEVDSTVKGFWNIMDNLQAKWHYVKKEVKHMAKNFHSEKQHKSCHANKDKPETESENWYFKKPGRRANVYSDYDEMEAKGDWLFKRAAQRAKHHRKVAKEHKKFA